MRDGTLLGWLEQLAGLCDSSTGCSSSLVCEMCNVLCPASIDRTSRKVNRNECGELRDECRQATDRMPLRRMWDLWNEGHLMREIS